MIHSVSWKFCFRRSAILFTIFLAASAATAVPVLAGRGEYAGLEGYIARMDESISGFEWTLQTGNPVTDVIVNDVRRRSPDLGIRFQADFQYRPPEAYDALAARQARGKTLFRRGDVGQSRKDCPKSPR